MNSKCPYCGKVQDPPPQRKRKCRDCGKIIYIQREGNRKRLITEQQHEKLQRIARDEYWNELNQQVQRALMQGDWEAARVAYWTQANVLFAEGRDNRKVLEEAFRCDLRGKQNVGVAQVEVLSSGDERVCDGCRAVDGKRFTLADAFDSMPLPGDGCKMCRCVYISVFDGSGLRSGSGSTKQPQASAPVGCASMIFKGLVVAALVVLAVVI